MRVDLGNIRARTKRLLNIGQHLRAAGAKTIEQLQGNWDRGLGGDGRRMKKLTSGYARRKAKMGRLPVANMSLIGDLRRGMTVRTVSSQAVGVTFRQSEMPKARGLFEGRPGFMKAGRKLTKAVKDFVFKRISG